MKKFLYLFFLVVFISFASAAIPRVSLTTPEAISTTTLNVVGDTNATTECGDNEVLLGNSSCMEIGLFGGTSIYAYNHTIIYNDTMGALIYNYSLVGTDIYAYNHTLEANASIFTEFGHWFINQTSIYDYNHTIIYNDTMGALIYNYSLVGTDIYAYNHTLEANYSIYIEFGKWFINQTSVYDYNQTLEAISNMTSGWSYLWYNYSGDYAKYNFTSNNFNGTGNFTTLGNIESGQQIRGLYLNISNKTNGWETIINAYPDFVSSSSDYVFYDNDRSTYFAFGKTVDDNWGIGVGGANEMLHIISRTSIHNLTVGVGYSQTAIPAQTFVVNGTGNITGDFYVGNELVNKWLYNMSLSDAYNYTIPANTYTDVSSDNLQTNITSFNTSIYNTFKDYNYNMSLYDAYNYTIPANTYTDTSSDNLQTNISDYNVSAGAYSDTLFGISQTNITTVNESLIALISAITSSTNSTEVNSSIAYYSNQLQTNISDYNTSTYNTFKDYNYNMSLNLNQSLQYNMSKYDSYNYTIATYEMGLLNTTIDARATGNASWNETRFLTLYQTSFDLNITNWNATHMGTMIYNHTLEIHNGIYWYNMSLNLNQSLQYNMSLSDAYNYTIPANTYTDLTSDALQTNISDYNVSAGAYSILINTSATAWATYLNTTAGAYTDSKAGSPWLKLSGVIYNDSLGTNVSIGQSLSPFKLNVNGTGNITKLYINNIDSEIWLYNQTQSVYELTLLNFTIDNRFQSSFDLNITNWNATHMGTLIYNYTLIASEGASPWVAGATTIYNATAGVSVGIGTDSPTNTLNVVGTANFTGGLNVSSLEAQTGIIEITSFRAFGKTGKLELGSASGSTMIPLIRGYSEHASYGTYFISQPDSAAQNSFDTSSFFFSARNGSAGGYHSSGNIFQVANYTTPLFNIDYSGKLTAGRYNLSDSSGIGVYSNSSCGLIAVGASGGGLRVC